ncbi:MAG: UDP-3-O-[3-hydroxymyristoyl] N-acetylglucosamine deacetylase [Proteobacteria bacterium]|nr:UDP-3-O-[3-hydroxymyristoyl] N-acetylglucosamine deacetylase [Pseudomonadota bacterium]
MMHHNVINFKSRSSSQKTIETPVSCSGIGTHTGLVSSITLRPAPENTGIVFIRKDLEGNPSIPALLKYLVNGHYSTKIGVSLEKSIGTIEHLMASLSALQIDNTFIDVTGPEIPIMDGSAAPFITLIKNAGIKEQKASRKFIEILKTVEISENKSFARLSPASCFSIEFEMAFRGGIFPKQNFFYIHTPENFSTHIANARTFGFFEDASFMYEKGLALGTSLENSLIFKEGALLNEEGLRYDDECVRHKVLDVVGDLALAGYPIKGHFYGNSSGHALNHKLLTALLNDSTAWCIREETVKKPSLSKKSYRKTSPIPSFAFGQ